MFKKLSVSLVFVLAFAVSGAQSGIDVNSSAAQLLVRTSSAMGVALPEGDLLGHLQALEAQGTIDPSTRAMMQKALVSGQLSSRTLNIFLADVLNGQEGALSAQQSADYVASLGLAVGDNDVNVDAELIGDILTNPNFADAIGDSYQVAASPINTAGD